MDTLCGVYIRHWVETEKAIALPLVMDESEIGFHVWVEGRAFVEDDPAAD